MAYPISPRLFAAVLANPRMRRALDERAREIARAAQAIAAAETRPGEDVPQFTVTRGVRPRGRPYARVIHDSPDAEFGTSKTTRRRYLGRAADTP